MASNDSIPVIIPPIWSNNVKSWFTVLECNFEVAEITCQKVKFCHLCSLLTEAIVGEISDLLPEAYKSESPYDALKKAIIERTEVPPAKAMKILSKVYMGDELPTEFLKRIRQLTLNTDMDDLYLKHFFFSRLPESVQAVVETTLDENDIFELARMADLIVLTLPEEKSANSSGKTDSFDIPSRTGSFSISYTRRRICWYHRRFGKQAYRCKGPCYFVD
ncbi:unnamed protein product [Hymenolepis diminuta]|uniref:DUF7041 domain-containing protein n=1 Tax=Hymenolepis diminuta TaxID=6216 RepID=A0A0R3STD1_HYMDI|nr:unnamed protein product [Hymenolepis diminuta]VUZ51959.1 unnamed protein product [Hymenolepis diminuta]